MKNVAAYVRVSTDAQTKEDKFGLEAQREAIIDYCSRNDYRIVRWFSDEGESGAKLRPGFDEIVYGKVNNPPIEAVVVAKSDRVARDIEVYYYYKMMLRMKEIELVSVAEDFGQMGVFASMLESFTLCVAQMERDNITKRTSSGRALKAEKGGYAGGKAPYGYKALNGKLEIVPEEAEIVREVFRLRDVEGKTLMGIAQTLNDMGYKTRSGGGFCFSTVNGIYNRKPVYKGLYKYGKNAEYKKGQHDPILPVYDNENNEDE